MILVGLLCLAPFQGVDAAAPRRARGWGEFPVFVWREAHAGKPLPEELAEPFGGVILMRGEESGWARERGLSYLVWNVAGRDALHLDADEAWEARVEKWIETRDEGLLVREPCLNDPEVVKGLFATLEETIARHGAEPGLGFVLGDEVGWTPNGDPFDLCACQHCDTAWQVYAHGQGISGRAPSTDEVRLALLEGDHSKLGLWLARRRFHSHCLMRLLEDLTAHGRRATGVGPRRTYHPPIGRVRFGLLGLSASAFGGVDTSAAVRLFDFVEAYPTVDAREHLAGGLHLYEHDARDFTGIASRTLTTIFVDQETPDGVAWLAWEHWLRGGSGLVLWSDRELLERPEHLARLGEAVRDIRASRSTHPDLEQRGGLILTDPDSVALSFLREALLDGPTWPRRRAGYQAEHGLRERKVRSWLRAIEDAGELPAVLPLGELRPDCAETYGFLVLVELLVLGEMDIRRLEGFLDQGGTLVVDGTLGWVNRSGELRSDDVLARLQERGGARVISAPRWMESYLEGRSDPERVALARSFLWERLGFRRRQAEVEALLARLPAGPLPWLVNRRVHAERTVLAFLPNASTAAERTRLRDVDLSAFEHEAVVWEHPRDGKTLRAGDAAILRLEGLDLRGPDLEEPEAPR